MGKKSRVVGGFFVPEVKNLSSLWLTSALHKVPQNNNTVKKTINNPTLVVYHYPYRT